MLPQLTPATTLGLAAATAYAAREGTDLETYLRARGPALTVSQAAAAVTELVTGPGHDKEAYLLTAAGLSPAP